MAAESHECAGYDCDVCWAREQHHDTVKYVAMQASGVVLTIAGLIGLYFNVEYSGWSLAAGILILL